MPVFGDDILVLISSYRDNNSFEILKGRFGIHEQGIRCFCRLYDSCLCKQMAENAVGGL